MIVWLPLFGDRSRLLRALGPGLRFSSGVVVYMHHVQIKVASVSM